MRTYLSGGIPNRPRPGHQRPIIPCVLTPVIGSSPNTGQKAFSTFLSFMWSSAGLVPPDQPHPHHPGAIHFVTADPMSPHRDSALLLACVGTSAVLSLIQMLNIDLNLNILED
jgi:hypothetical protein